MNQVVVCTMWQNTMNTEWKTIGGKHRRWVLKISLFTSPLSSRSVQQAWLVSPLYCFYSGSRWAGATVDSPVWSSLHKCRATCGSHLMCKDLRGLLLSKVIDYSLTKASERITKSHTHMRGDKKEKIAMKFIWSSSNATGHAMVFKLGCFVFQGRIISMGTGHSYWSHLPSQLYILQNAEHNDLHPPLHRPSSCTLSCFKKTTSDS